MNTSKTIFLLSLMLLSINMHASSIGGLKGKLSAPAGPTQQSMTANDPLIEKASCLAAMNDRGNKLCVNWITNPYKKALDTTDYDCEHTLRFCAGATCFLPCNIARGILCAPCYVVCNCKCAAGAFCFNPDKD